MQLKSFEQPMTLIRKAQFPQHSLVHPAIKWVASGMVLVIHAFSVAAPLGVSDDDMSRLICSKTNATVAACNPPASHSNTAKGVHFTPRGAVKPSASAKSSDSAMSAAPAASSEAGPNAQANASDASESDAAIAFSTPPFSTERELKAPQQTRPLAKSVQPQPSKSNTISGIISQAMSNIGVKYRFGGTSAETGFDCSGYVWSVFKKAAGVNLPRVSAEQAKATKPIDREELRPGDLVFFNTRGFSNSHVGIYLGDNEFIHAPRTGAKIRIERLSVSYWNKRFDGARRVSVPDSAQQTVMKSVQDSMSDI